VSIAKSGDGGGHINAHPQSLTGISKTSYSLFLGVKQLVTVSICGYLVS